MATDEIITPANDVSFAEFSVLLENIQNKRTKPEKEKVLTNFFNNLRVEVANVRNEKKV